MHCTAFYIFAKWMWAGKATGRTARIIRPCQGYKLLSVNVLKTCSQRAGKSRNSRNSITALMIKQASSEKCSPEWSPQMGAGGPARFCYIQCQLLWRVKSIEEGRLRTATSALWTEGDRDLAFLASHVTGSQASSTIHLWHFAGWQLCHNTHSLARKKIKRIWFSYFSMQFLASFSLPACNFWKVQCQKAVVADRSVFKKGMCECVQALTAMLVQASSLLTEVSAAIYQRGKKNRWRNVD